MQCREFGEISEAYLSDELLVETCIQVFRHLESCRKCRENFAAKRELRQKIRTAAKNSHKVQIDPMFANRLSAALREIALHESSWRTMLFANKLLIPALASLLLAITFGFLLLGGSKSPTEIALSPDAVVRGLTEISLKAVGDHKDCALEKLQRWEELSKKEYAEKTVYTEKVAKPLQANVSSDIEMLHAHDCIFEGKTFTHVILRKQGHVVSVFFDKNNAPSSGSTGNSPIISEMENGLQVASFQNDTQGVFVVSDLPEIDNLTIARTLSSSMQSVGI
jgi:hypothetical protein